MNTVFGVLVSAVIAFAVAAIVASRISSRVRVVDYLNARNLQIWGPNGKVQAWLSGNEGGAKLYFYDGDGRKFRAILRPNMLSFTSTGVQASWKHDVRRDAGAVERINLGVEEDGSAVLNFFSNIEGREWPPQPSIAEFKVSPQGNCTTEFFNPRVRIASEGQELLVRLGGVLGDARIKVLASDGSVAWEWPEPIQGGD